MTNGDRIREMGDEDLMRFIRAVQCCSHYGDDCGWPFCKSMRGDYCYGIKNHADDKILEWLKEESDSRNLQSL